MVKAFWYIVTLYNHYFWTLNKQGSFNKLTQFNIQLLIGSTQTQIIWSNTVHNPRALVDFLFT